MDECTQSCLSPFTACSERRQKEKEKSSCSNRCLSPIFKVLNRYKPNTYYLIIQGRYLVPGCGRRGQQLHWLDSTVDATSLYLKFPSADELFVNQLSQPQAPCFSPLVGPFWEHKRPRAPRQMMHTPRPVSVHRDGRKRPSLEEAKGFVSSEWEVQVDRSRLPHPRLKKKSVAVLHA